MTSAAEVYASQLLPRRHGLPLWQPEPTKFGEVLIGDVGFVFEGCFYRLFNAIRDADDPVNAHCGVPPDFVPLQYNETAMLHTTTNYLPPGPLYSSSMRQLDIGAGLSTHGAGARYRFACESDQGALAVLGSSATRSLVLQSCTAFRAYMHAHHDAWHAFAAALGHTLDADDIVLVSGWLKTSSWALAACTRAGRAHEFAVQAQLADLAGVEFHVEVKEDGAHSVEQRCGPVREASQSGDGEPPHDQCLFLRYYKMKRRKFFGKRLVAAGSREQSLNDADQALLTKILADQLGSPLVDLTAEGTPARAADSILSSLEDEDGDDAFEFEVQEEPEALFHDPIDDVLDYILLTSEADVAVASHDDLFSLCPDSWPENWAAFLAESRPLVDVDSDGVGQIQATASPDWLAGGNIDMSRIAQEHLHRDVDHKPAEVRPASPPVRNPLAFINEKAITCRHAFGDYCADCIVPEDEFDVESRSDLTETDGSEWGEDGPYGPYAQADYLFLMALELLRRVERTSKAGHRTTRQNPRSGTPPHAASLAHSFRDPRALRTAPQDGAPERSRDPGKYSARVLAAAPLAHVFIYRACARWSARPGVGAAAHLSAGIAAGAVLYERRKLKRLSSRLSRDAAEAERWCAPMAW
ncbi:hypothetical protein PsYK624_058790 [Phanerochaete sordida]|uniref:Uncharacterized protein n=1 Tax=Phanerochaete sordida TaxID=48140 RepID=A0A9P3LDC2_9APHY|nr:hypothetical protein PsYK624_058790 [Phanerochaete sordida]